MFLTCEIRTADGKTLDVLVLKEKAFKSGKQGFFGQDKIELDGRRYQCQAQVVEIAPKSNAEGVE